jgi:allantoate deiminase
MQNSVETATAEEVLARCDALAAFSEEPDRLTRRFATPELREAGAAVQGWMERAGLVVRRDAVGNVIGRLEGGGSGTLLMGSHLDTVRGAGRYDGMLGVLVALACLERARPLPFAVELIGFADEEGVRFGTGYLGSSALAGRFEGAWLDRRDADGITMADAIRTFGGDPDALAAAASGSRPSAAAFAGDLLGYVEVHIEQGPVLEAEGLPVGVVSEIAGQSAAGVEFVGVAGHAGTVPMALRHDALSAAAEWIAAVEAHARATDGLVATIGKLIVEPGASNVIPGRTRLSLDVRHGDDAVRTAAYARLRARAQEIAAARDLRLEWTDGHAVATVPCSPDLSAGLADAVGAAGHRVLRLPSGAGHDAAMMSTLTPVAMLFVRCAGGVSHNPAESVTAEDVAVAIDVTTRFLERLA